MDVIIVLCTSACVVYIYPHIPNSPKELHVCYEAWVNKVVDVESSLMQAYNMHYWDR